MKYAQRNQSHEYLGIPPRKQDVEEKACTVANEIATATEESTELLESSEGIGISLPGSCDGRRMVDRDRRGGDSRCRCRSWSRSCGSRRCRVGILRSAISYPFLFLTTPEHWLTVDRTAVVFIRSWRSPLARWFIRFGLLAVIMPTICFLLSLFFLVCLLHLVDLGLIARKLAIGKLVVGVPAIPTDSASASISTIRKNRFSLSSNASPLSFFPQQAVLSGSRR